jgi:hypothetical protein
MLAKNNLAQKSHNVIVASIMKITATPEFEAMMKDCAPGDSYPATATMQEDGSIVLAPSEQDNEEAEPATPAPAPTDSMAKMPKAVRGYMAKI